jgi:hypothetical protein
MPAMSQRLLKVEVSVGNEADCLDALQLDHDMFELMHSAGLRPEFIYASKKTDRLISESSHLITPNELKDWDDALKESRSQMKRFARPQEETEIDEWRNRVIKEAVRAAELIILAAAAGDGDEAKALALRHARLVQQKAAVLVRSLADDQPTPGRVFAQLKSCT